MRWIGLICAFLWASVATGCSPEKFQVSGAFGLPGEPGGACAAYFVLDNATAQADVLLGATSDIAALTEIHTIIAKDGVLDMRQLDQVDVPAFSQVEFKPGGLHLMFTGLQRNVKVGDVFSVTLHFQTRGAITFDVLVKEL